MYVSQLLEGKGEMILIGKSGQQRLESSTWEILNPSVFLLAVILHLWKQALDFKDVSRFFHFNNGTGFKEKGMDSHYNFQHCRSGQKLNHCQDVLKVRDVRFSSFFVLTNCLVSVLFHSFSCASSACLSLLWPHSQVFSTLKMVPNRTEELTNYGVSWANSLPKICSFLLSKVFKQK